MFFFLSENYAKHLVQTLLLGKYANNLSVTCQGRSRRGEEELWWKAREAQSPVSAGRSQLREAFRSGMRSEQLRVHVKCGPAQLQQHSGSLSPKPAGQASDFSGLALIGVSAPRKNTEVK